LRAALATILFLAALPIGGYGLLYLAAISTSDSSTGTLIQIGGGLLALAAILVALAVATLRVGRAQTGRER